MNISFGRFRLEVRRYTLFARVPLIGECFLGAGLSAWSTWRDVAPTLRRRVVLEA